jgi:hypothetical protein
MICAVTFGQVAGSKQAAAVAPLAGAPATVNAGGHIKMEHPQITGVPSRCQATCIYRPK